MRLEETVVTNRGYRSTPGDDRFYEYRIGGFRMDDGSVYGFKALETDDGIVADYIPAEEDPERAVRLQEYDLDLDDRLPGLEGDHLEGYGEAIAHELSEETTEPRIHADD